MLLNNTIRIAGAQIPVSTDIQFNKREILKALDWAKENKVDHLLTPEAALSGYEPECLWENRAELLEALSEIEDYLKGFDIIFHLGTLFTEPEQKGHLNRNQIRHYEARDGGCYVFSTTTKIACVGADDFVVPGDEINVFKLPHRIDREYKMANLICNDMWEWDGNNHLNYKMASEVQPDIILHSTNGVKFTSDMTKGEDVSDDIKYHPFFLRDTFDAWHDCHMRMTAIQCCATILSADSCVPWFWNPKDGDPIDLCKTSSPSGVINPLGITVKDVPRYGRQYFYYDLDTFAKDKCFRIVNSHSNKTPYHGNE
tara:strand:+ start:908 stop:1846 length:939 start_codon:yes stop_codon:yes gene_type:complete